MVQVVVCPMLRKGWLVLQMLLDFQKQGKLVDCGLVQRR